MLSVETEADLGRSSMVERATVNGDRVRESDDPECEGSRGSKEGLLAMLAGEHASGRSETTKQ